MKIIELPRLRWALALMGTDNGADVTDSAVVPDAWEMRARLAEDEMLALSATQVEDLVMGEEGDQSRVAEKAPNANEIICAAFDGDLSDVFMRPWNSIYDARRAEVAIMALIETREPK